MTVPMQRTWPVPTVAVRYQLTEAGSALIPVLDQLSRWAGEKLPEQECSAAG